MKLFCCEGCMLDGKGLYLGMVAQNQDKNIAEIPETND